METVDVRPARAEDLAAVRAALCGGGDGCSCQCQWWTMRARDFQASTRADREEALAAEVLGGHLPGLVAFVGGAPAGWVRVGPRTDQVRLAHTRAVLANSRHAAPDPGVWAVTCFSVRREHRGAGLMGVLLRAAMAHAAARGARVVEGYPVAVGAGRIPSNDLYRGSAEVFLAAGFSRVADLGAGRVLVEWVPGH